MLRITDLRVTEVTETSARITWRTNLPADTQVVWGKDSPCEFATPLDPRLTTRHVAVLDGLESGAYYSFTAISRDAAGTVASLDGQRFRTRGMSRFINLCDGIVAGAMRELPAMGTCVSWGDFDNDGDFDVFIGSERTKGSKLFRNGGDRFSNCTFVLPETYDGRARSAAWADFDMDGDADLLVVSSNMIWLFRNEGSPSWRFSDISHYIPPQARYDCEGAGWLDYNSDGLPDILVTNGRYGILLFENRSKRGVDFGDVSDAVGLGAKGFGRGFGDFISIVDYAGDGRTDFLYNLYSGILGRNIGGKFVEQRETGIDYYCSSTRKIGTAFGDYDNDGDMDLFVPQRGQSQLYRNESGRFIEVTESAGIIGGDYSVAAAWGDVNNDGLLDLYVANEFSDNRLYITLGDGRFRDEAEKYGVQQSSDRPRGTCFVDYDGDGDLDIYVRGYNPSDFFYENTLITENNHNYLKVRFAEDVPAIGARVSVFKDGELMGTREISGGEGYGSQPPPEAHFGLKPGKYKVIVRFTDGTTREMRVTVGASRRNVIFVKPRR